MATTEPHAGPRTETKPAGGELPGPSDAPVWPSHDLIRRNAGTSTGEGAGAVRPGPLPGSDTADAAAVAAAIRAAEQEAATADVTAAEIEAAEAAAAELAAAELGEEFDDSATAADGTATDVAAAATAADVEPAEVIPAVVDSQTAPGTSARAAASPEEPRRPTKFMADLTAAMRAAAEAARETTIEQLRADAVTEIETIRTESTLYTAIRRERAEEDVTGIREWSQAEIARIRAETEENIAARRRRLDDEMAEQATRLEAGVANVESSVTAFEQEMEDFFDRLLKEEDPSRFATMAGQLPEPAPFESWSPEREATIAAQRSLVHASDLSTGDAQAAPSDDAADGDAAAVDEAGAAPGMGMVAVGPGDPAATAASAASNPDDETTPSATATAADATSGSARQKAPATGAVELTQVVVVGLVSVASIATFKRMIARTAGVKSVHVSSGPEGEFIFGVTHQPAVDLAGAIAGLAGFSPTVVAVKAGEISVAARDPEQAA